MKVENIKIFRTDLIPNTGQEEYLFTDSTFDPDSGLVVEEARYTPDGQVEDVIKKEYDQNGNLILLSVTDAQGYQLEKKTFEQDSSGRTVRELIHYADESADTIENTFDEKGRLIKRELYDEDGELETREVFEYHGDHLVREAVIDSDGNLSKEISLKYSDQGLIIQETVIDNEEELNIKKVYSYNSDNKLEEVTTFDPKDKALERITYSYDENGKPKIITEETTSFKNTTTIGYNPNGDVILEEEVDHNGQVVRKIEREMNEKGLLATTRVLTRNLAYGITRSYQLRNEYSFKS